MDSISNSSSASSTRVCVSSVSLSLYLSFSLSHSLSLFFSLSLFDSLSHFFSFTSFSIISVSLYFFLVHTSLSPFYLCVSFSIYYIVSIFLYSLSVFFINLVSIWYPFHPSLPFTFSQFVFLYMIPFFSSVKLF